MSRHVHQFLRSDRFRPPRPRVSRKPRRCSHVARHPHFPARPPRDENALDEVLRHPGIWRRGTATRTPLDIEPTGIAGLDAQLPGGGWPRGALSEILIEHDGIGECSLVLPALAALTQARKRVVFVAPPYIPYPPALIAVNGAIATIDPRTRAKTGVAILDGHPEGFQTDGTRIFANVPDGRHIALLEETQLAAQARWRFGETGRNFPMAIDDEERRLLVVTRGPAELLASTLATARYCREPIAARTPTTPSSTPSGTAFM